MISIFSVLLSAYAIGFVLSAGLVLPISGFMQVRRFSELGAVDIRS